MFHTAKLAVCFNHHNSNAYQAYFSDIYFMYIYHVSFIQLSLQCEGAPFSQRGPQNIITLGPQNIITLGPQNITTLGP